MKTLSKYEKLVYYNNRIYSIQFFFRLFSPLPSYFFYLDPGPHVGGCPGLPPCCLGSVFGASLSDILPVLWTLGLVSQSPRPSFTPVHHRLWPMGQTFTRPATAFHCHFLAGRLGGSIHGDRFVT